jgi:hypothetical protein
MESLVSEVDAAGTRGRERGNQDEKEETGPTLMRVAREIGMEVVIPTILSVAEEIPFIDRISRLLSKCGNVLQELSDQDCLVEDLRREISKVKESLQIYEEVFQFDDKVEEIMKTTIPFQQLEVSLEEALQTLLDLSRQGNVLGVVFTKKDNENLKEHIFNLSQSLQLFCQSIPLYQQRLQHQQRMNELLHYPEVFHSAIRDHLSRFQSGSRQWLFEEVSVWLTSLPLKEEGGDGMEMKIDHRNEVHASDDREKNRVFWIRAEPGMGKSAFAATLSKKLKEEKTFLGAYFCRHTEKNESPSKIIRSLAAQCCENLSSLALTPACDQVFEKAFFEWDQISDGEKPSPSDLFDLLLTNPLREYSILMSSRPHPPMVFLVDALDEVSLTERKPLLYILSSKIQSLPSWVKIVITSRPEADIVKFLNRLNPFEIMEDDSRHLSDIRLFVSCQLREVMNEDELGRGVELFVSRSEGRFIYVANMISEILKNRLSGWTLSDLDDRLPECGMVGWYREFFLRMRTRDEEFFDNVTFRVVRLLIGAREPLSVRDVKMFLKLELSSSQERLVDDLRQLFPLRNVSADSSCSPVFVPFHKSVFDWLTKEESSGPYHEGEVRDNFYISKEEANKQFLHHFQSIFVSEWLDGGDMSCRPPSGSYFYRHAFYHFLDPSSNDVVLFEFGWSQLFRMRVLVALLEEVGVNELIRILESYSIQFSSRFPRRTQDISDLQFLLQLVRLSSPGLKLRDADALPFQFLARLTPSQCDGSSLRLKQLYEESSQWRSEREEYWLKPLGHFLTPAGGSLDRIIKLPQVSISFIMCPECIRHQDLF